MSSLSSYDEKLFKPSKELEQKVVEFLDKFGLNSKLRGYTFIKDMIIYQTNKKIFEREFNETLYGLIALKYDTNFNNVVRQVRYVCYEGNKNRPTYPIDIMYEAWYVIKLNEEKPKRK